MSLAIFHPNFVIRIFPSEFCHPQFSIRILSSAFFYPPSAAIRSALYRDPDFADSDDTFEQFVKDEDACSDFFSDCEDPDEIDSECIQEQCETESDQGLYSGAPITSSSSVVLLLSFVFKHKLTREAFNDLLAVIEAHCPRPNNCKTTVNKLFQFLGQAKGNVVKHHFCGFCKAYFGKDVKGNCNICGKSIQNNGGFFIEVPIVNQLLNFFSGKYIIVFIIVIVIISIIY